MATVVVPRSEAKESATALLLRDVIFGLLLGLYWALTPVIIAGYLANAEVPQPMVVALKHAPPITAKQLADYCARAPSLPSWRDPACK